MSPDKFLLKEAVDALQKAVTSSNTPYPLDFNVLEVIPLWNKLFNAIVEEGKELYFTVRYAELEARERAVRDKLNYVVTGVRGRFKEIANTGNMSHATYKYQIEDVEYVPISSDIKIEPALKAHDKILYTWIELYTFLATLTLGEITWEIL